MDKVFFNYTSQDTSLLVLLSVKYLPVTVIAVFWLSVTDKLEEKHAGGLLTFCLLCLHLLSWTHLAARGKQTK